ncbi:grpE protein homolog 1, mitochondrial-like [Saccoglossus kowalevskii]|uniref:GrpE protein homolog n=1 Tax=Saccoglossus kowalevskii TaxID=10224 RepID=A0ABM0GP84_SACKO|nr:PREDICTED: grpE protein homolog 1, mitochondrial-like [Saccoglossus kowalevskii]
MAAIGARVFARSALYRQITATTFTRSPTSSVRFLTTDVKENVSENKDSMKDEVSQAEKQLQEEKSKLQKQLDELTDKYKRALAETENVRNQNKKQLEDIRLYAIQGFCKDLLEIADILGQATESVQKSELDSSPSFKSLFEGLKMTESQLLKVFSRHGLTKIEPLGEKFNPNLHEALFELPVPDKTPGTVAVVSKIGYKLHDRTVRPAIVGVAKAP